MVGTTKPTVGYSVGWVRAFLQRGSGVAFDESQASDVVGLAEQKLFDLFDVAAATALANGRARIFRHDLPLTKGLQHELAQAEALAGELELQPLLVFLADSGAPGPLDDGVRDDVPRLMAALLLLAGRIIAILEPANVSTEERLGRLRRRADPVTLASICGSPCSSPAVSSIAELKRVCIGIPIGLDG